MKKHVLMLTTSAFMLACGAIAANAQQPGTSMMPQPNQQYAQHHVDKEGAGMGGEGGMMGHRMMGGGMMGPGMMRRGGMGPHFAMRIIFALMDSDGDGTVSLQEFQAAHEKIFKAMDANKDGVLTPEEIQAFMRGTSKSTAQHEQEQEQEQEQGDDD
jgi:EF hand